MNMFWPNMRLHLIQDHGGDGKYMWVTSVNGDVHRIGGGAGNMSKR